MKNFFIVLFLLIIAWFVLLFVKPDHEISQKLFSYINISVERVQSTEEIDLTDCISYFDGCNTCMITNGQIGGCTRMFCETMQEPRCLEYARTWIDLSDCASYFDGCNTCTVLDGKPHACTMMYCEHPEEPKCLQLVSELEEELEITENDSENGWEYEENVEEEVVDVEETVEPQDVNIVE